MIGERGTGTTHLNLDIAILKVKGVLPHINADERDQM